MGFDAVKNLGSWGTAVLASLALHIVVLFLFLGMRGCGGGVNNSASDKPQSDVVAKDVSSSTSNNPGEVEPKQMAESEKDAVETVHKKIETKKIGAKKNEPKKNSQKSVVKNDKPVVKNDKPVTDESSDVWKSYKVRPGDSLSKIARNHGCTVAELAKVNGLSPTASLQLGQTIKVKDVSVIGQ